MTLRWFVLLTSFVLASGCGGDHPVEVVDRTIAHSFNGTVSRVEADQLSFSVEVGSPVLLTVSYSSNPRDTDCSVLHCTYSGWDAAQVILEIGDKSWVTHLYYLTVRENTFSDEVMFGAATNSALGFPGFGDGIGNIDFYLFDREEPYELVEGLDLPLSGRELLFAAKSFGTGAVYSHGWSVQFTLRP